MIKKRKKSLASDELPNFGARSNAFQAATCSWPAVFYETRRITHFLLE
jgi:hypothetical protein